jgi:Cu-Zn family superoxide dismutase
VSLGGGNNSLLDADRSSIVIHEGPDDYRSDPAGAAGKRIACGVISR